MSALYFKSQRQLFDCRERLGNSGIAIVESDLKPTDRFLMERFITGGVRISGASSAVDGAEAQLTGAYGIKLHEVSNNVAFTNHIQLFTGLATSESWFAELPEAKTRGYKPGRFSFNVKGGRCEACQGEEDPPGEADRRDHGLWQRLP